MSSSLSSLYQQKSSSTLPNPPSSFTAISSSTSLTSSASSSTPFSHTTLLDAPFVSSYYTDPFSFYGSYSSAAFSSWPQLDTSLKRPGEEVNLPGDAMSKRARFELTPMLPIYPQRPGEKDCVYYMRTRTCSYGATCKYDHPVWVPAGGIPDWKEVSTTPNKSEPLPVRAGEPDCAFYVKTGICKFGSKCKFNHPENKTTAGYDGNSDGKIIQNAVTTSATSLESTTTSVLTNDKDGKAVVKPVASYNTKGLPIRPGEPECSFYMKTGSCKFGSACCFNHPERPASTPPLPSQSQTTVTPFLSTLPGAYGNYSIIPTAIPDYGATMPIPNFGLPTSMQAPIFPQRPGEPFCAFYMKTGVCKFTSTCKFHHPLDRKEVEPVKLTLAGFPRREGEQACPFYMKTGTCKYGLSCKFDHPPPGEAAAKAIADAGKSGQPEAGEILPNS